MKEGGRESPREFSVSNSKPSALSRITNVTELNPVAVVSDGAVGYCVICNFMHACPKRGVRRKWRDFVVRVIARARKQRDNKYGYVKGRGCAITDKMGVRVSADLSNKINIASET